MTTLRGHHAIVTGGGRGIGRAIAASLTKAQAVVTVFGRTRQTLDDAVAGSDAAACEIVDVTDKDQVEQKLADAARARGPISILVNNAGSALTAPFAKTNPSDFLAMFSVHVMGAVYTTRAVLPSMVERGFGRVVNIASTAGLKGYGYVSAYCTAKHALVGLTRSLAAEVAKSGVTVNAVCPGYTETDMVAEGIDRIAAKTGRTRESALAAMVGTSPLGRLIRPEEVAASVLFLCSPEAAAVTGTTIAVAGGEV